jgi:hypothetical protein
MLSTMELHKNCAQMVTLQNPIPALDWLSRDAQAQKTLQARDQVCAEVSGEQRWPQRWQGEMERYVTGGAIGVYEKGGAEEMEPREAPAVSVLILIWGHHEVRCSHPQV